ncbi:MAG: Crp/Fnr family transcriptional regulator [Bryobacteraceae bacterium]|nr:Crp/Fnr family transcriptional regulator [Bryobacteraceae bacterium]
MNPGKRDQIARVPLFSGLSAPEIDALAARAVEKKYDAGQMLFSEGEPCQGIYLILEGSVKIYKTTPSGREITLALEIGPSSVAEVPLFDGGPYPASVVALDHVVSAFIHTRDFHQACRQFPEVSLKMLAAVGRRLRQLVTLIELVTFGSIRQRLAALLLEYEEQARASSFSLPVTHQELASRLGTVREVVSRNISRFQVEGLIRIAGRQVHVLDRDGLKREAETEL